ncbi:MAG: hypothetical protein IPL23_15080 [Saprospiraceae bacterium]|nr:hypothetical protein [Saprospiraceae bacterium]
MKHFITSFSLLFVFTIVSNAQVGINTTMPNSSAALDVTATDKGLLIPRVTTTGDIASPTAGMMVYQTGGTAGFYFYDGQWTLVKNDNLGNHTATTDLNLASQDIIAVDSIGTAKAKIGPNTYPTTTGSNGQMLTTDGAGALSWGSTSGGGGAQVLVRASANSAQSFAVGSSLTVPAIATCIGNVTTNLGSVWNAGTGIFTAPSTGLYMVSVQTISTGSTTQLVPSIDVDNNQSGIPITGGGGDFFGVMTNLNISHPDPYKSRCQIQALVFLNAAQTFSLRIHSSSNVVGTTPLLDGSTNLTVIKLN